MYSQLVVMIFFFFWYPTQNASQKIEKINNLFGHFLNYIHESDNLAVDFSEVMYFNLQHKDLL